MHSEVAKLVEAGRISQAVGERISQVSPGNFLVSKSWGAGKVASWNLREKKVTIDFADKRGQEMDLQFVMQKTEFLDPSDFRAKKLEQTKELRELSIKDPVQLAAHVLSSHGGSMTLDAFEKELNGPVIPQAEFKKWWDTAKKVISASKKVTIPPRRTDLITLRGVEMTATQALLADFDEARDLKNKIKTVEAINNDVNLFQNDLSSIERVLNDIDVECKRGTRLYLGNVIELLIIRDEIVAASKEITLAADAATLPIIIKSEFNRISEAMAPMSAIRQRVIYDHFPAAFGDVWIEKILAVVEKAGARGVGEIAKIFDARDEMPALEEYLRKAITRRSLGHDALIWVCRERESMSTNIFGAEVGAAILNQLESDFISDGPRKSQRLQSLLGEDKELLYNLVGLMDVNEARNFGRRLMECPVFSDLDRKSLMARVIKARPETSTLVSGEDTRKQNDELLVSWESLERKKNELEDMTRNRIPQNTKEISVARSHGDLRENFEYKAAKDMQKYLMMRKSELERELTKARGTDFKGADTSSVNIGTVVTLKNSKDESQTISVLGAWDSDPDKKWVSYLSEAGAGTINKKINDFVSLRDHDTEQMEEWSITNIQAFSA
jgi:transcription elongation GreA/GreB family factor